MTKPTKKEIDFAKKLASYKNQWVALQKNNIVAHNKDLEKLYKQVKEKKLKNYVFHLVPDKPLVMMYGK